ELSAGATSAKTVRTIEATTSATLIEPVRSPGIGGQRLRFALEHRNEVVGERVPCNGVRQVRAPAWYLLTRRLHLRPCQRRLRLPRRQVADDHRLIDRWCNTRYRASKYDCQACHLKSRCCPKEPARYVPRSIYEGARDMAREIARSWEGPVSRRLCKKAELLFAHLKRIFSDDQW